MSTPPPLPNAHVSNSGLDLDDVYAFFLRRFGAVIIDYILIVVVLGIVRAFTPVALNGIGVYYLLSLVAVWLYYALCESSAKQATLGKMAFGIKVCSMEGDRISFPRATGRHFAKILSGLILYIGFLMAAFTPKRQGLHDMLASTLVVRAAADKDDVQNAVTPSGAGGVVVAVVVMIGGVAIIGILAAIAIPAYQDYAIRAQITEGLSAASPVKAAIAEALANAVPPTSVTSTELKLSKPTTLRYVEDIEVEGASVVIQYGGRANPRISGKTLLIVPAIAANGDIVWLCGRVAAPLNAKPVLPSYQRFTTVEPKYLPTKCRG